VRAVLIAGSRVTDAAVTDRLRAELGRYQEAGGRVACVGQDLLGVATIAPANREGAADLARSLAALGHTRFAVLAGPPQLVTAIDRRTGFAEALADLGLPEPQIVHGSFDRGGGYTAVREVADATCVFAVNDVMAVGALAALRERGVRVPDDISVAGFDDIATLRDLTPALSTVRLPLADMGARAVELALSGDHRDPPVVAGVEGRVILRDSVRNLS
jgi:LacI family transcriptional regulator